MSLDGTLAVIIFLFGGVSAAVIWMAVIIYGRQSVNEDNIESLSQRVDEIENKPDKLAGYRNSDGLFTTKMDKKR